MNVTTCIISEFGNRFLSPVYPPSQFLDSVTAWVNVILNTSSMAIYKASIEIEIATLTEHSLAALTVLEVLKVNI